MTRPDDWHLHLRDGPALEHLVADSAKRFSRAIIMPNLRPPVTTTEMALAYRERILEHVPAGLDFNPLMTLYLTEKTSTQEIARAAECGHVHAIKLYPAGATTNSDAGVRDLESVTEVLHAMQDFALPLLVHGEVVDPTVDVFDREQVFIERHLGPLSERFPDLRIVFEHITTEQAVGFVTRASPNVAATITAHHLLLNRNALFDGGLRPHHYCLPVVKRERHRVALLAAATGDSTRFFLGTDSAPHARHTKETACGCAGIYTSHAAIELYAEAFAGAGALDKLERFAAFNGPAFYGLAPNTQTITLRRRVWEVPDELRMADQCLVPFRAGERISWTLDE